MTCKAISSSMAVAFALALMGIIGLGGLASAQDEWQRQRAANQKKYDETMAQIRADRKTATGKYDDKYPKGNTSLTDDKAEKRTWSQQGQANQSRTESDADFARRENEAYQEYRCENQRIACEQRQAGNPNPSAACGDAFDRCMSK